MSVRVSAGRRVGPDVGFIVGLTKPTRENVGLPAGTELRPVTTQGILPAGTTWNGTYLTITSGGTAGNPLVLPERLDIPGYVRVQASHVELPLPLVRGTAAGIGNSSLGLITAYNTSAGPFRCYRGDLIPDTPSGGLNAAIGKFVTLERCYTKNVVDGSGVFSNQGAGAVTSRFLGVWFDTVSYFAEDGIASHTDGTHNDAGGQVSGGSDVLYDGCRVTARKTVGVGDQGTTAAGKQSYIQATSGLMLTPDVQPISDVTFRRGWIEGGVVGVNASALNPGSAAITGLVLEDIEFDGLTGNDGSNADIYISAPTRAVATIARCYRPGGVPAKIVTSP